MMKTEIKADQRPPNVDHYRHEIKSMIQKISNAKKLHAIYVLVLYYYKIS